MTAPNVTASPASPNPETVPTPSAPPTSGTPAATPSTPNPLEQRLPTTGVPEFLAGKTVQDVATLAQQLYQQNQQLASRSYAQPAQPVAQPAPVAPQPPPAELFLTDPQRATQLQAEYMDKTQFQPRFQNLIAQNARQARSIVEIQRGQDFKKWGPEIDLELQKYGPETHTPENIAVVVDMVRARHVNEIVAEEIARQQREGIGNTARPSGTAVPGLTPQGSGTIDMEKLPPNYAQALRRANVTQGVIDEFLVNNYIRTGRAKSLDDARTKWTEQAMKGDVITDEDATGQRWGTY